MTFLKYALILQLCTTLNCRMSQNLLTWETAFSEQVILDWLEKKIKINKIIMQFLIF